VDGFITAEDTRSYKPSPEHWRSFMEKTGARPDQILHAVQSVYHDIVPAGDLGLSTAWVNRYGESERGVRASYVMQSLDELTKIIP
jgi:FMN phosphatase YigB (HAD superfamily)